MRRTVPLAPVLVVLAVACSGAPESAPGGSPEPRPPIEVQDGLSFTGWWHDAFHGPKPVESMTNLADTGAGWVAIIITWYQDTIASTDIHPTDETPPDDDLVRMIRTAHRLGLKVMLKPHIDLAVDPVYDRPRIGTAWGGDPAA